MKEEKKNSKYTYAVRVHTYGYRTLARPTFRDERRCVQVETLPALTARYLFIELKWYGGKAVISNRGVTSFRK